MGCQVFIETYGCQMNVYDSELVSSILVDGGFKIVNELKQADVTLINTCSVLENANNKSTQPSSQKLNKKKTVCWLVSWAVWQRTSKRNYWKSDLKLI